MLDAARSWLLLDKLDAFGGGDGAVAVQGEDGGLAAWNFVDLDFVAVHREGGLWGLKVRELGGQVIFLTSIELYWKSPVG